MHSMKANDQSSKPNAVSNPDEVMLSPSETGELLDFNMLMMNFNKRKEKPKVSVPRNPVVMELCCPFQDCMCNANEAVASGKKSQGKRNIDYPQEDLCDDDDDDDNKSQASLGLTTVVPRRMSVVSQITMHSSMEFDSAPICCPFEDCVCMSAGVVPFSDLSTSDHLRRVCREAKFEQSFNALG